MSHNDNVDPREIDKFDRMANHWWDPEGECKPLHQMNPVRANYIDEGSPVAGRAVLDVGCGGGLLSEALAARGAAVTGIDMGENAIAVAREHARESGYEIDYLCTSAETHAEQNTGKYDIVTCLEMLEHVPDPASVVAACAQLVKPGGAVYFSTINRHPKAWALAVVGAEYLLRMLPRGTHDYGQFIKPSELARFARSAGLTLSDTRGLLYNPLSGRFRLSATDLDVNYLMHTRKPRPDNA